LYILYLSSSTPTTSSFYLNKRNQRSSFSFSVLVVLPSVFSMNLFCMLSRG